MPKVEKKGDVFEFDAKDDFKAYKRRAREAKPELLKPKRSAGIKGTEVKTGKDPDKIKATERKPVRVPVPNAGGELYTIRPGDSYSKIAHLKYGDEKTA